jgi:sulfite dehydrogenase (quinone) subunit SoeC
MHPAPSVIIFTVLSGLGFGFMAYLGAGLFVVSGWPAFFVWGIGYGLAVVGLLASTFHLGNPKRALKAFSQWRTSWLSREAWASVATLLILAPMALSDWLGWGLPRGIGILGAVLCLVTVLATSMIYAQIKAVPRWHFWTTPVLFLAFSLAGGAVLAGQGWVTVLLCGLLLLALLAAFQFGDLQFARQGASLATATGLGRIGEASVFELPHTGGNYLLREMIHVVGRKHAARLRLIAIVFAAVLPAVLSLLLPVHLGVVVALLVHLIGAFAARWLFFAEAEHVVGLYYGQRG